MHLRIVFILFLALGSMVHAMHDGEIASLAAAFDGLHIGNNNGAASTACASVTPQKNISWADVEDDEPVLPASWKPAPVPVPAQIVSLPVKKKDVPRRSYAAVLKGVLEDQDTPVQSSSTIDDDQASHKTYVGDAAQSHVQTSLNNIDVNQKVQPQPHGEAKKDKAPLVSNVDKLAQEEKEQSAKARKNNAVWNRGMQLICKNWQSMSKKDAQFLERTLDAQDVEESLQLEAFQALGRYYNNPGVLQDIPRAKQYMERAIQAGSTQAMADIILLCFHQKSVSEMDTWCQKLVDHDDANPVLKDFAKMYRSIVRLVADEQNQWAGEALASFKEVVHAYGWQASMRSFADSLPEQFYVWMRTRLNSYQQKSIQKESTQEASTAQSIDAGSKDAAAEWLYVMARMHLDGAAESFRAHRPDAIKWMRAAAAHGHWYASAHLGSMVYEGVSANERIAYLQAIVSNSKGKTNEDMAPVLEACERNADTGHIGWLTSVLYTYCSDQMKYPNLKMFDDYLSKLRNNFPPIKIPQRYKSLSSEEHWNTLASELERRAPEDWTAHALLYAMKAASLYEKLTSNATQEVALLLEPLQTMTARMEQDVKKHPKLKPLLAVGYATLGKGVLVAQPSNKADAAKIFEKAVAVGGDYEKYEYAKFVCEGMLPADRTKAVAMLQEVVAKENFEFRSHALEDLIRHFITIKDWGNALAYAQQATQWAHRLQSDPVRIAQLQEREQDMERRYREHRQMVEQRLKEKIRKKENTRKKITPQSASSSSVNPKQTALINRIVNARANIIQATELADKPLAALKLLKDARAEHVVDAFEDNPGLLIRWGMAVSAIRKNTLQGNFPDERLKTLALNNLLDHIACAEQSVRNCLDGRLHPDTTMSPMASLQRRYLILYQSLIWLWRGDQNILSWLEEQKDGVVAAIASLISADKAAVLETPLQELPIKELYWLAIASFEKGLNDTATDYIAKFGNAPEIIDIP